MKCITLKSYDIIIKVLVQKEDCNFFLSYFLFTIYPLWLILIRNINPFLFQALSFTRILFKLLFDQASKYDDGSVRIQRPREGPFYVSYKTIDELIANFENFARLLYFIVIFCVFLVYKIFSID
jgi:hypothetical protein